MHGDKGPSSFLDQATTAQFAKVGYVFGPVKKRKDDLGELAKEQGIPFQAHSWEMKAGQGIIFEPAQVLHRGWLPTTGHRYVLVFCLLPSPVSWQVVFEHNNGEGFSSGYTWHEEVRDLLRRIQ